MSTAISTTISVDVAVDTRPTCRSTCMSVDMYVGRHVCRSTCMSVDMYVGRHSFSGHNEKNILYCFYSIVWKKPNYTSKIPWTVHLLKGRKQQPLSFGFIFSTPPWKRPNTPCPRYSRATRGGGMLVLKFLFDRHIISKTRETFFNRVRQEFDSTYMEVMEVLIHIGFSEPKHIGDRGGSRNLCD